MAVKFFQGLRPLRGSELPRDALAGVTAASANIPQVLGYSAIAGMPVVTGLYTVLLPLLAFAAFGSSRRLVVAADSATAAIVAGSVSALAAPGSERYVALVGMLVLMIAALLLLARIFRLGFLADFLSRTVLVGFLAGVGVQVAVAMLGDMLGMPFASHETLAQVRALVGGITHIQWPTLALSMLVAGLILVGRWRAPHWPAALVAVVVSIAASVSFDLGARGIAVIGPVSGGLPSLRWPEGNWRDVAALWPVALSCVVMIIAQSAATARIFATRHHERVDEDADLLGLAAANVAAGLSGTFVVNGSPSQTAMVDRAGAQGQAAMLVLGSVALLVLLFFTGPLQYLPKAVLAAVVFTIALGMIDFGSLAAIRRESRGEFMLAAVTAAAVVVIGVEQGVLLAIVLSLLRHVRHSWRPHKSVLVRDAAGRWEPHAALPGVQTAPGVLLFHFGADLFYANADDFADTLRRLIEAAPQPVRWLLIDAGAITALDYSAAQALRELLDELARRRVTLVFARVSEPLRSDLQRHGISAIVGPGRVCATLHEAQALAGI